MAVDLDPATIEELNGTIYLHNETGEPELDINRYHVLVAAGTPGAGDNRLYCADPQTGTGQAHGRIVLTAAQTATFMTDQFVYLRDICAIPIAEISDASLYEICLLRLLSYKHRLISPAVNANEYHVLYNDCKVSDAAAEGSRLHQVRAVATYDDVKNALSTWLNANRPYVRLITHSFSNMVCTVAYVFRQKGHHYITGSDYADCYQKIWAKVDKSNTALHSSWAHRSTIALHAIMRGLCYQENA